jgi:hypothetical protein
MTGRGRRSRHVTKTHAAGEIREKPAPPPGESSSIQSSRGLLKVTTRQGTLEGVNSMSDPLAEIVDWFTAEARAMIEASGKDPADWRQIRGKSTSADGAYFAANVLTKLDFVKRAIADNGGETCSLFVLLEAFRAGYLLRNATIAEHETSIDVNQKQREAGSASAKKRSANNTPRDKDVLQTYFEMRKQHPRKSATWRKVEAGKPFGLRKSRAVAIVDEQLAKSVQ